MGNYRTVIVTKDYRNLHGVLIAKAGAVGEIVHYDRGYCGINFPVNDDRVVFDGFGRKCHDIPDDYFTDKTIKVRLRDMVRAEAGRNQLFAHSHQKWIENYLWTYDDRTISRPWEIKAQRERRQMAARARYCLYELIGYPDEAEKQYLARIV